MVGVVIGVNKERGSVDLSIKPSYLTVNESWWIENRTTDKNALKWYDLLRKDPTRLYDRYFDEKSALKELYRVEKGSTSVDEDGHTDSSNISHQLQASAGAQNGQARPKIASEGGGTRLTMRQVNELYFSSIHITQNLTLYVLTNRCTTVYISLPLSNILYFQYIPYPGTPPTIFQLRLQRGRGEAYSRR